MIIRSRLVRGPRSFSCGALLFLASAAAPGIVFAQDVAGTPQSAREHRIGPLSFSPEIALRDIGVDSNVYNTVANPVSDVTFTVGPTVNATARVRRAILNVRSSTDLVYFARQASERSVNENFAGSARYPLRRITFGAAGTYLNTRERPDQEIDARSRRVERSGEASVAVAVGPKLSAQILGRSAQTVFDADAAFQGILLGDRLNRTTDTLSVSARYAATPLTALIVSTESATTRFERASERNADSRRVQLGVELQPRALIAGAATLGYERFSPRSDVMPAFTGLVGNGSLMYRLRPSTGIGFSYDRELFYSYSDLAPYYLRSGVGLLLRRQLAGRWFFDVSGGRYHHRYRSLTLADSSEPVSGTDQTVLDSAASVTYLARPGTQFVVGLAYHQRDAGAAVTGYRGLRFGTSITYGF